MHEDIPDLAKLIDICLITSRSQSDTERVGKLTRDISDKRFGEKYNEAHKEKGKNDRVTEETFIYANPVSLHCLPLQDLKKEWAKKPLPALMRTNPDKESSTLKTLKNKQPTVKFWFH